jgi:hypothetical protein
MSEEIKSMHELLNELNDNLKKDCCALSLKIKPINFLIKLYDTIEDACLQNENFAWYPLIKIIELNKKSARKKGIVCNKCNNGKCLISLRINSKQHTRFAVIDAIELMS